jgi:hypothetical protein
VNNPKIEVKSMMNKVAENKYELMFPVLYLGRTDACIHNTVCVVKYVQKKGPAWEQKLRNDFMYTSLGTEITGNMMFTKYVKQDHLKLVLEYAVNERSRLIGDDVNKKLKAIAKTFIGKMNDRLKKTPITFISIDFTSGFAKSKKFIQPVATISQGKRVVEQLDEFDVNLIDKK